MGVVINIAIATCSLGVSKARPAFPVVQLFGGGGGGGGGGGNRLPVNNLIVAITSCGVLDIPSIFWVPNAHCPILLIHFYPPKKDDLN